MQIVCEVRHNDVPIGTAEIEVILEDGFAIGEVALRSSSHPAVEEMNALWATLRDPFAATDLPKYVSGPRNDHSAILASARGKLTALEKGLSLVDGLGRTIPTRGVSLRRERSGRMTVLTQIEDAHSVVPAVVVRPPAKGTTDSPAV